VTDRCHASSFPATARVAMLKLFMAVAPMGSTRMVSCCIALQMRASRSRLEKIVKRNLAEEVVKWLSSFSYLS
jgi:hypothetical protein